jgi:hypothetical protein
MTGAVRRYLLGRDSLVDEIRAMVPYNLRASDGPLPRELGNRLGLVYLTLPVGIRRSNRPPRRGPSSGGRDQALAEGGLSYRSSKPSA